ncbi:hypothetical protein BH23BAC1_BH23BAC1_05970 [soil metagenome]
MNSENFRSKFLKILLLASAFCVIALQEVLAQCAMCKTTVENNVSYGEVGVASKLNLGIIYLFFAPYLIVAVIGYLWYKNSKANARKIQTTSHFRR